MDAELNLKLEKENMSIPDVIDKNTFIDIVNMWDY